MRALRLAIMFTLLVLPAGAVPQQFDLQLDVPPIITDSQAPKGCTVTYLIEDTDNNDLFAARMRISPAETDTPVNGRLPCPARIAPAVAARAMEVCSYRASDPKYCVFADMARGFETEPNVRNTAENTSRCSSDQASDIAAACWQSGHLSVCNVGCGNGPKAAVAAAIARCQEKQERSCPITATLPVSGP
jgi:hypothetical protein